MSERDVRLLLIREEGKQVAMRLIVYFIVAALVLGRLVYLQQSMLLLIDVCRVYYPSFSLLVYLVGVVLGQQCPSNGHSRNFFGILSSYSVPLNIPFCSQCCSLMRSPACPPTAMWSLDGTLLTNGSVNGSVLINSETVLILPNPGNVLSVGNVLSCTAHGEQHDVTITKFSKL